MSLPNLLEPISGGNPSGANLRVEPVSVYDRIKEARRKEDPLDRNDFQRPLKEADYRLVVRLATEALSTQTKDLQIAAWLTEALVYKEGLVGLTAGLNLLRGLIENFWDTLYPEVEDNDLGMRSAPLSWVGEHWGMDFAVRSLRLTKAGFSWLKYKESRTVGYEADADTGEKIQARQNAIREGKLTAEEFDADVAATQPARFEEVIARATEALETVRLLDKLCSERFKEDPPSFRLLQTALEEVQHTARILGPSKNEGTTQTEEENPDDIVESVEDASASAHSTAAAHVSVPSGTAKRPQVPSTQPADSEDAIQRIVSAATYLRSAEPHSPVPYLALRGLRWGELRCPDGLKPESLQAPSTETRQELKKLVVEEQWKELLERVEITMGLPCGRAWLDLQRYAVRASTELGSEYTPIANAIRSELQTLLRDFPKLPTLALLDDTPAANKETQDWLVELTTSSDGSAPGLKRLPAIEEPASESVDSELHPPDPYHLALEAAQAGETGRAMQILSEEITRERSGRGRFLRRMQLAQICVYSNRHAIAYPILQDLAHEIELRHLESWEQPETLAELLALLLQTMQKLRFTEEATSKIYAQICRLDPIHAARLAD